MSQRQDEFRMTPAAAGGVGEELSDRMREAQVRLAELDRQRQTLELQRRELEDLQQKQREMEDGRKDLMEQLSRSLKVLERAEDQARREVEQIVEARTAFTECLEALDGINPDAWNREHLEKELGGALGLVDEAGTVYRTNRAKLRVLRDNPVDPGPDEDLPSAGPVPAVVQEPADFGSLLLRGFAQNFSLFLLGLIALLAYLLRH